MKKLVFIIIIILPSFCYSQTYLGLKTGYSLLSTISFNPDIDATIYTGKTPDFGLAIKNFDNKWVGFQGEIYITKRGYNAPLNETFNFQRVNSYIELPIFFQIHYSLKGLSLHANAGCFAAYMLSAKEGADTTGALVMNNVKFNILRDNRFDYGLVGGIGISHEFKWGVIQLEARILYGYTDLYKYTYTDMPNESKAVVQNVSFSYLYNLSKIGQKKKTAELP